ncbi:Gfo/Idh/MocA family protein [Metabacillus bambusae]|uniref:Gfo/Idh/MocA family oxidoreductase n=1 Tax=Metabacillus bambusae TaxID=2795218 RepID=A0ABS3N2Y6_9BACI|nr:Gfo/Idh/MocA family oxidoreductase [Metabacillus bambusae]MBO1512554.1 Gfo/Idh/MocA family oxidoreductase [Metabacillus bambusae]
MSVVRWGILSTANIGQEQLIPAIHRSKNAEIVAIASSRDTISEIAERLNIPHTHSSYEALLQDPTIDAVYIPLPNHLHKKWVIEAAKYGKHVLCEKPATLNSSDTEEMIAVCHDQNVKFMEAFMYQFDPMNQRVRDIIASGEIGDVKLMRSSFSYYLGDRETNIRMKKNVGGGALYDVGCYCIHAIRNIIGSEPIDIKATAKIDTATGVDITTTVQMELENGIQATFDCSFDMYESQYYEVIGTKGKISVPFAFRPDQHGGGIIKVEKQNDERIEKYQADNYVLEVEHFSQVILDNKQPIYTAENAIQNMRVIEACLEAIETGRVISLSK